MSYSRATSI